MADKGQDNAGGTPPDQGLEKFPIIGGPSRDPGLEQFPTITGPPLTDADVQRFKDQLAAKLGLPQGAELPENYAELYGGKWIATNREHNKIFGASADLDKLYAELEEQGVPLAKITIEYVIPPGEIRQ